MNTNTNDATLLPPIFIGGVIKSGTSLLRAMLGKHSNIASGLETYWFDMQFPGADSNQQEALPGRSESDLRKQLDRLGVFFDIPPQEISAAMHASNSSEDFLDIFMGKYAHREAKGRWLEKTPGNVLHLDRIFSKWPEAKFIFCVRNPLDVYSSCLQAKRWEDPETFANIWANYFKAYEAATNKGILNAGNCITVEYEKVILHSVETITGILEFINEPYEEGVATYEGQSRDFELVRSVTGKSSTTLDRMRAPLQTDRIGIYRDQVSSDQLAVLERTVIALGLGEQWSDLIKLGN